MRGPWLGALIALAVAALWAYDEMQRPLYEPGYLLHLAEAAGEPRHGARPRVANRTHWEVAPGVFLHHVASRPPADGRRNVVVLHGGPGEPAGVWEAAAHDPLSRFALHFYDQRGCGLSTRPFDAFPGDDVVDGIRALDEGLGIGVQLADLDRVRRLLGEERLLLVGHGYGGFLAALYAAELPDRVERLVLVSPAPLVEFPPEGGGMFGLVRARLPAADLPGFDDLVRRYVDFGGLADKNEASMQRLHAELGGYFARAAGASPERLPSSRRRARLTGGPAAGDGPGGWMAHAQYASMGAAHDYSGALAEVTAPTLIVHGGRDLQPLSDSRKYAAYLTGAVDVVFRSLDRAGHFAYDQAPKEFARVVGEFLS